MTRPSSRFIKDIESLTQTQLESHGYYRGFPCPHNHTIRDNVHHWCYHCVRKIESNMCGFDLNYLSPIYKNKYHLLWMRVKKGLPHECWPINIEGKKNPKRMCFPSYRSHNGKQLSENTTIAKAIYQCAWGDIGSAYVTRKCKEPWCCNPLHLSSKWNKLYSPRTIHPFVVDYDPAKLMYVAELRRQGLEFSVQETLYKPSITPPVVAAPLPSTHLTGK